MCNRAIQYVKNTLLLSVLVFVIVLVQSTTVWGADILMVTGTGSLSGSDVDMASRLTDAGHSVTPRDDGAASTGADAFDLVIISETCNSRAVNSKYRTVGVPLLSMEAYANDDMHFCGATKGTHFGDIWTSNVTIENASHPLAAGLSGTVSTSASGKYVFTAPVSDGVTVASAGGKPVIIAYEQGEAMYSTTIAPAKRATFFAHSTIVGTLTNNGWALFDAAIDWCVGGGGSTQYSLNVAASGNGSVTLNPPGGVYDAGTQVEITATPLQGYQFDNWSGDATSTANPLTVTMNGNVTITANFSAIPQDQYVLNVTVSGNGSVTKNPDQPLYNDGVTVGVTPVADPGWQFENWSGDLSGSAVPENIVMSENRNVTAIFSQITYELTINNDGNGTTNPAGLQTVNHGENVSVTATPNASYTFSNWTLESGSANITDPNSATATITLTSGNASIQANFSSEAQPLSVTSHPAPQSVSPGESVTFTVAATGGDGNYTYQWYRNNAIISGETLVSYTLANTTLADDGARFKCSVTSDGTTVESNEATLTVSEIVAEYPEACGAGENMKVDGDIHSPSIYTSALFIEDWKISQKAPDYVFDKDYKLQSIEEIESFIKENSHLPGVPSAQEMRSNGIDMLELNFILLKKIEEMTLLMIEQQKKINELNDNR